MISQDKYGRTIREEARDNILTGIIGFITVICFLIFLGMIASSGGALLIVLFLLFVIGAIIYYFVQFINFIINNKTEKFMKEMIDYHFEKTKKQIAK